MDKLNNNVIVNEVEDEVSQLVFKPIDDSINFEKINNIKIEINDNDDFVIEKFNFDQDSNGILTFNQKNFLDSEIDIKIKSPDVFDEKINFTSLKERVIDNISNPESISFNRRKSYLTDISKWVKVSLKEIEDREKIKL